MEAGFTLIEVLMVVTIIGILAVVLGWGAYRNSIKKSRDGRRKADLEQIRSGLEMYRADVGSYPDPTSMGCDSALSVGGATYITSIPCDPQGGSYVYSCVGGCSSGYDLTATLEYPVEDYTVSNP